MRRSGSCSDAWRTGSLCAFASRAFVPSCSSTRTCRSSSSSWSFKRRCVPSSRARTTRSLWGCASRPSSLPDSMGTSPMRRPRRGASCTTISRSSTLRCGLGERPWRCARKTTSVRAKPSGLDRPRRLGGGGSRTSATWTPSRGFCANRSSYPGGGTPSGARPPWT